MGIIYIIPFLPAALTNPNSPSLWAKPTTEVDDINNGKEDF